MSWLVGGYILLPNGYILFLLLMFSPEWHYKFVCLAVFSVPCSTVVANVNGGALQSDIRKITVTVRSIKKVSQKNSFLF